MSLFVVYALDKPGSGAEIRAENRPRHLEWLKSLGDKLRVAGPILSDDGDAMIGSMLLIEANSLSDMKDLVETDPYAKAGLFERTDVRPYNWLLGADKPD